MITLLALSGLVGCSSSIRVTDPPRTATEQFLLSTAAFRAVEQLSVESLRGRTVYIDTTYFAAAEPMFVISELRAKLLLAGVEIRPERGYAQIVLEVRSPGVGIDRSDYLVGIPSILIRAGTDDGAGTEVPLATPELSVIKNITQRGIAGVAFIAYWRETGEVVASSGPFVGWTLRDDWWFFGFGRRTVGDIAPTDPVKE